ncbi:DUF6403 family protein [Dactylosporangium sp. NPDC051541]|uniref:DUF6403 family protein n=1 Tax=Dactylosporangium sp. NPDC051541 TaxID=3363977 RepID=UPI0037AED019
MFWLIGAVVIAGAGFAAAYVPRARAAAHERAVAWSEARAAIGVAVVGRDAARTPVPEAEELLTKAEAIAAGRGGAAAAREAARCARAADRLWRAAADRLRREAYGG